MSSYLKSADLLYCKSNICNNFTKMLQIIWEEDVAKMGSCEKTVR